MQHRTEYNRCSTYSQRRCVYSEPLHMEMNVGYAVKRRPDKDSRSNRVNWPFFIVSITAPLPFQFHIV
jgi:hypothetical protein